MARKMAGSAEHGTEVSAHGDRPWVYFMIDCFLLITNFFIITFKFKNEEPILPQKMPPGSTKPAQAVQTSRKDMLAIHVSGVESPVYEFMTKQVSLQELAGILAGTVTGDKEFQVRVSYDRDVPWGYVMAVFNECTKVKINECGLVPLRGLDEPLPAAPSGG